ncbi:MAG: TonB-dependent receptor, partial [Rikenellaceae bacterium]
YRFASYINEGLTNASKAKKFMPDALDRMKQFQAGTLKTNNIPDPSNPNAWANAKYNANDNVNWFDELFGGSSFSHEHTLSLNGGTEKLQVYASLNYLDQNGLLRIADDSYKRYSTNLRVTGDIFPFLDFSYNIKFNREDFSRPTQMGDGAYGQLTQAFPNMPFKDANGFYYEEDYRAPMALSIADGGNFRTRSDNMYQQLKIHADPIKNWNINAEMNYRLNSTDTHTDTQLFYNHSVDGEMLLNVKYPLSSSSVQEQHVARNYINPNIYTDYSISINDAHNFKIMLGFQAERQWISSMSAMRNGIIVPYMDQIDVTNGNSEAGKVIPPTVSGNTNNWATAGFFGRLNYDYKGRYLLEVNARYDGTSRYRVDKRWKWFPSFSAGWNVAKEKFWEDFVNTCRVLKVRASYGELGNQNTSLLYPTYQTLGIGAASGGWLWNFAKPTSVGSPNLLNSLMTWETIKSLNVGLDVAFFKNRLTGSFDWFRRTTADMVGPGEELPNILGKNVPDENNTELKSTGWELSLKWQDRLRNGLGYSVGVLLSDSQAEITKYPNPSGTLTYQRRGGAAVGGITVDAVSGGNNERYLEGQKMGEIWGYETIGIAKTQAEMDAHLASLPKGGQVAVGKGFGAGDIMYKD